jgi:hypothetical protein
VGEQEMHRMRLIGLVILAVALGGPAMAGPDRNATASVADLDSDNDKTIDISEMGKAASDTFDNMDSDGDGKIDLRTSGKRLSKEEFKKADTDKDDLLDKNEYFAAADSLLRAADKDKDGVLDEMEFNSKEGKKLQRLIQ